MQGADRVNDEFEVGYDERFENRWLKAEHVGRIIMLLFVGAGLAGLFGRGPFSHRTDSTVESALAVDFEPIARSQAPTQVTFHIANPTNAPTIDLFIGTNTIEPMGLKTIEPQPATTKVVQDGLLLTFPIPPGTKDALVRLMLEPSSLGPNQLIAQLAGHAPLRWTQFIMP